MRRGTVPTKNNNRVHPRRLRKAAWLVLASLAWMPLAIAGHQFEHVDATFADTCEVCVQLDRSDDAVAEDRVSAAIPAAAGDRLPAPPADLEFQAFACGFDSRAPPKP